MDEKIKNLIESGQSENLEFKSSLADINEIVKDVSAFSNLRGGRILVGISNSGKILGVEVGKDTAERLTNKIVSNTEPKVFPSITIAEIDKKKIIVVEVTKSPDIVFAFGRAFKRVGKSTLRMSKEEIKRLILERKKVYWDEQICEGASLDDIDWKFVNEEFTPLYEKISERKIVGRPIELLKSLGCVKNSQVTNAGILLFGKNPQKFFINSYIALGRYRGKEISGEKLDYKEFSGNLFQQIDNCNKYIVEHTAIMSKLIPGEVRRRDIPEYGRFSIRELITNAVCHRDYSDQGSKIIIKMFDDRIEFYNPGSLPAWITPKNITVEQYSRNPMIAKVLAKVKYIEELGEGWDKIIKEHKEHPLKPKLPRIKVSENSFLVTLFSTKEKFGIERKIPLSEREKKIVNFIRSTGRITTRECASLLGVSSDTALRELSKLKSAGLIKRKGVGRSIYYVIE
jgi:ATP-dependent DNA helicase RecG